MNEPRLGAVSKLRLFRCLLEGGELVFTSPFKARKSNSKKQPNYNYHWWIVGTLGSKLSTRVGSYD